MLADLKMLCPALVLALAVLCLCSSEVDGQCWENTRCQDLSSEENILECIQLCKLDLTAEFPIYPGNGLLEPLTEAEGSDAGFLPAPAPSVDEEALTGSKEPGPRREDKRSYSMEHFRWGKPVGRKRRPIKVYANGMEEESTEAHPVELRRGLSDNQDYPVGEAVGEAAQDKKDGSYRMNHFRWSGPPANKRYGGFLKSWDERSQKPLLTLFRNVIIKDSHLSKTE